MTLQVCDIIVQTEALVLLRTPLSNSGTATLRFSNNSAGPLNVSLSTDCPHLTIPSGSFEVPNISTPPNGYDFIVPYDISTWPEDCRDSKQCGWITVTVLDCEATPQVLEIPVYIWDTCDVDDYQRVCDGIFPSGIWLDANSAPGEWARILTFLPLQDTNYRLNINGCPWVDTFDADTINPNENGGAFDITFDLSNFEECGTNIHACTLEIIDTKGEVPCNIDIPVYVTNECPDLECPIGWADASRTINKNTSETGTFSTNIINNSEEVLSVTLTTDCPYLTLPEGNELGSLEQAVVEVDYDVTEHVTCGSALCGTITASVEYGDGLSCEATLPVTIEYKCPVVENDVYETSLLDDDGNQSVEISSDCQTITIVDESAWSDNGHAYGDFTDYRRITIKHLQTGDEYVLSSLVDGGGNVIGDELILPAATQTQETFIFNSQTGGVYEVKLCNFPTWAANYTYQQNDDIVYYDGKLYAAISESQGVQPFGGPNSATNWVEVTEDTADQYSDKYCDVQIVISSCNLDQCFATKYKEVACDLDCNSLDFCKNQEFLDLLKLEFLLVALDEAIYENDMETATIIYDKANQICNC